jgi:hypothetical protein
MAAITITAANVAPGQGATIRVVQFGEAVTAGMPCYLKAADNKYWKADANAGSAEAAAAVITLTKGDANGYGAVITAGKMQIGATVTKGEPYFVGATAGDIVPAADLASGWYTTELGIASSTTELVVSINASGQLRA